MTPLERRREIYAICREYSILLLEDDPYYYLQWPAAGHGGQPAPRGFANLGTSYLSLDTDGRVVRLDSFSKARDCCLNRLVSCRELGRTLNMRHVAKAGSCQQHQLP